MSLSDAEILVMLKNGLTKNRAIVEAKLDANVTPDELFSLFDKMIEDAKAKETGDN